MEDYDKKPPDVLIMVLATFSYLTGQSLFFLIQFAFWAWLLSPFWGKLILAPQFFFAWIWWAGFGAIGKGNEGVAFKIVGAIGAIASGVLILAFYRTC